jgi:hypothetical protein
VNNNKNSIYNLTEDEKKYFDKKLEKILQNTELKPEEKAKLLAREIYNTEKEILSNRVDGEINIDPYGNIDINIYKEEENEIQDNSKQEGISII